MHILLIPSWYKHKNTIHGHFFVFFIFTKYAAYCTHAGSYGETKLYGAMKLLHFEMMKMLKNLGVKRYDLVGVKT